MDKPKYWQAAQWLGGWQKTREGRWAVFLKTNPDLRDDQRPAGDAPQPGDLVAVVKRGRPQKVMSLKGLITEGGQTLGLVGPIPKRAAE